VELRIPWSRGDVVAAVHREGEVLLEQHQEEGTLIQARLDEVSRELLSEFIEHVHSGEQYD
jgi:GTP-binding protein HflX